MLLLNPKRLRSKELLHHRQIFPTPNGMVV